MGRQKTPLWRDNCKFSIANCTHGLCKRKNNNNSNDSFVCLSFLNLHFVSLLSFPLYLSYFFFQLLVSTLPFSIVFCLICFSLFILSFCLGVFPGYLSFFQSLISVHMSSLLLILLCFFCFPSFLSSFFLEPFFRLEGNFCCKVPHCHATCKDGSHVMRKKERMMKELVD